MHGTPDLSVTRWGLGDLVGGGREALSVVGLVQRSFVEVRGRERERIMARLGKSESNVRMQGQALLVYRSNIEFGVPDIEVLPTTSEKMR